MIASLLCTIGAGAQTIEADSIRAESSQVPESIFPDATQSLVRSHFTWGAEIGASIDLSGTDLSTFDIDALFGYKNSWIRVLGVGAGVHRSFGRNNMFIPVYAVFRTSFTSRPSLFFFNAKAGYSFNTIMGSDYHGGFKSSLGAGINLAMSRRFQSHIILSAGYFRLDSAQALAAGLSVHNVVLAQIAFGMNF